MRKAENKNDRTKTSLEKEKIELEIKNLKRFPQNLPFWTALFTFLIFVLATIYSWKSGIFETKQEKLELETTRLEMKRDTVNRQINDLLIRYDKLLDKHDSLALVAYNLKDQRDSINKILISWRKTKQGKSALKVEVLEFISELRDFDEEYRNKYDSINGLTFKKIQDFYLQESFSGSTMVKEYERKYKTRAIIYREKMLSYLPDLKILENEPFYYEHPTNMIGIENIISKLEYMAEKLEE